MPQATSVRVERVSVPCAYRKSNPAVVIMQSAQDSQKSWMARTLSNHHRLRD